MPGKSLRLVPSASSASSGKKNDSADYVDWAEAHHAVLPDLKPTTRTHSLRPAQHRLDAVKAAANARDVPYRSLIKIC